jgi:RNA polymerase sigma-70 factor (ECF subfamily)
MPPAIQQSTPLVPTPLVTQAAASTASKFEDAAVLSLPFPELVQQYSGFVWRSLRFHGVPDAELPDQSQEVFLVIHRRAESFEGRNSVRAWVYGICRRVAAGYLRKAYVKRESVQTEAMSKEYERYSSGKLSSLDFSEPAAQREQAQNNQTLALLEQALSELPEEKREVFVLYEIEELGMKEIANMLSCPLQTAYSRLHAAREHVRRRFRARQGKETDSI